MNLPIGNFMDGKDSCIALEKLDALILKTRETTTLPCETVLHACDILSHTLNESDHLHRLLELGMPEYKAVKELQMVKRMMSREYLETRMRTELGGMLGSFVPYGDDISVRQEWKPLGVLLHIAAGNVDALPVFSVIEGLLTGNINLLKLPGHDDGLSIPILLELIKIEPLLSQYVFALDLPSQEMDSLKRMASVADAIVVWGGDAAISSIRNMAAPNTRIIEWGHKISFAYISGAASDSDLEGICYNICDTNQIFCNSCQGIFIDTDSFAEAVKFAERFAKILDRMAALMPNMDHQYLTTQRTLELYTEKLESANNSKSVFCEKNCSVIAYNDMALAPSYMYRSCWVRPLPNQMLLLTLGKYKNHLQTAALICEEHDRSSLENLLAKTGIVRITNGRRMSESYCGIPHDGEFSLRRYMKIVSYEY